MNKPVLLAALVAALPGAALAQEGTPGTAPPPDCAARAETPRAESALPARASTRPEPQLGTVAPNTRVPSHTDTPSRRAMAAASARAEKMEKEEKKPQGPCAGGIGPRAPENGGARPEEA